MATRKDCGDVRISLVPHASGGQEMQEMSLRSPEAKSC